MRSDDEMPGHKLRRNKDGTIRHGWAARHDLVKAGYQPKWVRLHYNFDNPTEQALAGAACRRLQQNEIRQTYAAAELTTWSRSAIAACLAVGSAV